MAPLTENQIFFCCRTMKGRIGEGKGVGRNPGNMGVCVTDYAVEAGGRAAYIGNSSLAPRLKQITSVALRTLVRHGAEHNAMIPAVEGNPAVRVFARFVQAGGVVVCGSASPHQNRRRNYCCCFK